MDAFGDAEGHPAPQVVVVAASSKKQLQSVAERARSYDSIEYWDKRYETEESFEWLGDVQSWWPLVSPHFEPEHTILHIGCGNSPLSKFLHDQGFHHALNTDYSATCITKMSEKHPEVQFKVADCLDMKEIASESFEIVLDKAVCDTISTMSDEENRALERLTSEVGRVLKFNGKWIIISYSSYRSSCFETPGRGWRWQVQSTPFVAANEDRQSDKNKSLPTVYYYLYVGTKIKDE